ncbi:MAG: hypothetical protein NTU88_13250, partial [Armatimonadetes bacterium]|nr:hypothetical protein [Armatimonadota bacterium]
HDHLPGRYMRYQGARNLIDAFEAVKAADTEIVIHATGFTRSPWWLRYVDLIGKDALDISDSPAPSMRDSEIVWTDSDHRFFETDPGTCVTYSDSHFWAGRQCWRKSMLMSLARSNQIALSGQIGLLDEDDRLFLQRVYHMRKVHATSFEETRRVDLGFGVYGYADTANGRGVVALYNPSCHYDRQIEPWQVIWFEVGPSEEQCEHPSDERKETRNVPMLVTPVSVPADVPNVIPMPVEQVLFGSGSTFRCAPVLPRTWQGFPLCIDYSTGDGEIYINNQPLLWHDGAAYALMWPWTRRYGMMRFGKPNLFYMATDDVSLTRQPDIVFSALPYFSGSACREDWPYPGDCTLVALVRFLKDGEPFRHSHDPRTVRCAVWMDGVWTEIYRMPPNVPHIRTKVSWSVFKRHGRRIPAQQTSHDIPRQRGDMRAPLPSQDARPHDTRDPDTKASGRVTVRAIVLALVLAVANDYWLVQLEVVRYSHPSYAAPFYNAVFTLLVLTLANFLLRSRFPKLALSSIELLTVYVMVSITSGICS